MTSFNVPATTKRFAQLVNRPGGSTITEATKAANANIEGIRETALIEIGGILDRMYGLGVTLSPVSRPEILDDLYDLSNTILGVAGLFGLAHVGAVAYSLCELIDRLRHNGRSNANAVRIHLDSLRLMHTASPTDVKQAASVQRALQQLVSSIPGHRA